MRINAETPLNDDGSGLWGILVNYPPKKEQIKSISVSKTKKFKNSQAQTKIYWY